MPTPASAFPQFHGRLLLVDDDPINLEVGCGLLGLMGCDVRVASHGEEALTLARQQDFDLILMDCQMPMMDGWTATRRLRAMEREGQWPPTAIVGMTAYSTPEEQQRCREAGMNGVLAKPFNEKQLMALLEAWLGEPVPLPREAEAAGASDRQDQQPALT